MKTQAHGAQLKLPSPAGAGDFWDIGDADFGGQQLPPDHEFSQLVAVRGSRGPARPGLYVLLALVLAVAGLGAYDVFVLDANPLDQAAPLVARIKELLHLTDADEAPSVAPGRQPKFKRTQAAAPTSDAAPVVNPLKVVAGNPYWSLPNDLYNQPAAFGRTWSTEEEETLRAGLTHHFTYQRYKTVQDVRKSRHLGSDVILWDALQDRKLWTRMAAALGLAELNIKIKTKSLEQALGHERSELIASYFERFVAQPTPPALFLMRAALRLLDERGRLVVLRGLHRSNDALRDVYMAAATLDPGARVQEWVRRALRERPVAPARLANLVAIIKGEASADALLASLHIKREAAAPTPTADDDDGDGDDSAATDGSEDVGDDGAGGVEFYEKDATPKAAADKPNAATFDYKD